MGRRVAREVALKALFAYDLGKNEPYTILEQLYEEEDTNDKSTSEFSRHLVEGVIQQQEHIDGVIEKYAIEWDLQRMATVDRNIMRMALFEILYLPEIPEAVTVNEAIEIAKIYGSEDSARFINGILGNVIKELRGNKRPQKGDSQ